MSKQIGPTADDLRQLADLASAVRRRLVQAEQREELRLHVEDARQLGAPADPAAEPAVGKIVVIDLA